MLEAVKELILIWAVCIIAIFTFCAWLDKRSKGGKK